ncbi:hypothetical protein ACFODO_12655 [Acinetobacter sichuanensis]|uniref:Uncharacterized protein n=1 Tax=Acinetobacter sichuanensis TaxID=2136183 RepID=A0A371YL86_9GAMM|nr:hypothetical protein [Acinetobacter sichuanensis]RFC82238.1 hypothetical protein C9E89_017620 [Acinetobacter sichuanensis]
MTQFSYTVKLKKTVLASLLGLGLTQSCFALEALTDENLSESTGEGIAFLPENVKMVFQAANDGLVDAKADWADRKKDTGLIRMIPVGPLTTVAANAGAKKADIFLYGLALSRTDGNLNSRFSNIGASSGSESNPWVMSVETQSIPNFAGVSKPLSYLQLEAPLAKQGLYLPPETIKLGLWGDVFARDASVAKTFDVSKGAPETNAGLVEKLRLQVIANGLYLNGSQARIFQTLDGATTGVGGLSASYNNTLGLGLLLRLNTDYDSHIANNWSDKVLRISTREKAGTAKDLTTPAINGGSAPDFDDTEGLYMYSPNINLVLGNIYQPLIIDTPDGKNLTLEVTRIPNQASVYKNIYTDYSGSDTSYKGSTCNVRSCGDVRTIAGTSYQGTNATHSSISIGKVGFDAANKNLSITDKSTSATGVLMRGPSGDVNLGSAAIDGLLIQHFKITTTGL